MITIARFSKPELAHLFRTQMEAGGIPAFVQDENTIQMDWFFSDAMGGVRVEVADEDQEAALELMRDLAMNPLSEKCPNCQSLNSTLYEGNKDMSVWSALRESLANPDTEFPKDYLCLDCSHVWAPDETDGAEMNG